MGPLFRAWWYVRPFLSTCPARFPLPQRARKPPTYFFSSKETLRDRISTSLTCNILDNFRHSYHRAQTKCRTLTMSSSLWPVVMKMSRLRRAKREYSLSLALESIYFYYCPCSRIPPPRLRQLHDAQAPFSQHQADLTQLVACSLVTKFTRLCRHGRVRVGR